MYPSLDPCAGFDSDFANPRPPEGLQVAPTDAELRDTPLALDDPVQPTLIQLFLSELQSHAPCDPLTLEDSDLNLTGLGELELEQECNDSGSSPTSSVTSYSVPTSPPTLECMPQDLFNDPMDDPFLSSFTDISVLQESFPLLSGGMDNRSLLDCNVNIEVVKSSESSVDSTQQKLLNLAECIDLLNTSSSSSRLPSTSPAVATPSASPVSPAVSTSSSPETPHQTALFLCDFDFSAISTECLTNLVSTTDSTLLSAAVQQTPTSPLHQAHPTSHETTPTGCSGNQATSKNPRKRESPEQIAPESSSKVVLVSSESLETGSSVDKHKIRRIKNNKASQVTRAKRRQRRKNMEERVGELEEENERMREQEKELTVEIEKMKKLLLDKLTK